MSIFEGTEHLGLNSVGNKKLPMFSEMHNYQNIYISLRRVNWLYNVNRGPGAIDMTFDRIALYQCYAMFHVANCNLMSSYNSSRKEIGIQIKWWQYPV